MNKIVQNQSHGEEIWWECSTCIIFSSLYFVTTLFTYFSITYPLEGMCWLNVFEAIMYGYGN